MMKHKPLKIIELRKLSGPIPNVNQKYQKSLSRLEKIAVFISEKVGTVGFFFLILAWTISWLSWNIFAPTGMKFDPYPAFVLWLFISNMIQIFLMPLIMVGQNLQGKYAEVRAEADFEVNVKAEREIETILQHLENDRSLLRKIYKEVKK